MIREPQSPDEERDEEVDAGQRIIERPDGFYWVALDGRQEFGPYPSRAAALADMDAPDEGLEPGESLHEAEQEIGIADWIDPDTGEPAEGTWTRIEDH